VEEIEDDEDSLGDSQEEEESQSHRMRDPRRSRRVPGLEITRRGGGGRGRLIEMSVRDVNKSSAVILILCYN